MPPSPILLDALPDAAVVLDPHGQIVAVNDAWGRLSDGGGDPVDLFRIRPGDDFLIACAAFPPLGPAVREELAHVLTGGSARLVHEYPITTPVGGPRWYALIASALAGGGALVAHREITRRKAAEATSARLSDQRLADRHYYEELLAGVPAVVWDGTCRRDGSDLRVSFVSRYVERLVGYALGEWLTTPDFLTRVTHPGDRPRLAAELARLATSAGTGKVELRWVCRDARVLWVEAHLTVRHDPADPDRVHVRGVVTDVTAHRQTADALRQRADELARLAKSLRRSNEELDQYAYVTSHDLKAPLRGIANLSNWIEEDLGPAALTPEARHQFELLRGRVHRMEALIDGILAYSRVGRVRTRVEPVDVARLLHEVVDLLALPPGFRVEHAPGLPVVVGERQRLQQVLMNLVSNAYKHHHDPARGLVTVSARDAGQCVEFCVADDGPGIDPAYHGKIFVMFQTLRPRDRVEGTGVGLSLVKKIVEDQGGTVRVESAPGRGSRFYFTWQKDLRAFRPPPPSPSPAPPPAA